MSKHEPDENIEESFPAGNQSLRMPGTNHRAATDTTKAEKDKRQKD